MAKILAVDDSQPIREMVTLTLKSGGHEIVTAVDGAEGLALFKKEKFDLVVTDINMPEMDGFTLIREIRALDNKIPVLALTTESEQTKRQSGQQAGVDGWIVKPFKPAQFLAIVKQILE